MIGRVLAGVAALALLLAPALADPPPATAPPFRAAQGALLPVAIYDAAGNLVGTPGDTVVRGTAVFRGGTITAGGTSQVLMAANATRRGWSFQNQSSGNCGIKVGGAAATLDQNSLRIAPGQLYESPAHHVSTAAIAVTCAATGATFYATEF